MHSETTRREFLYRLGAMAAAVTAGTDPLAADATGGAAADRCLVGVYYFAGWWRDLPNKYVIDGKDWREEYAGRRAVLGEFNEQATMDREILAASRNGVSFFQILWYPPLNGPGAQDVERLDAALGQFMRSPHAPRLRFTVEYVNHAPFDLPTDPEWSAACRTWIDAMRHPSYLRVAGRPVMKLHHLASFVAQAGGLEPAARRLSSLRDAARSAGVGDPLLGGGVVGVEVPEPAASRLVDYVTSYMDVPDLPKREEPYPYADLLANAEKCWRVQAEREPLPYVPFVPAGWDPRPWRDPRPSFTHPTDAEWRSALRAARAALDGGKRLGYPAGDGRVQKALLIYAWNEFGEGGAIAPSKGHGYAMLDGIREVFGR